MQNTDFSRKMQQIARKAAQAEHKKKSLKNKRSFPQKTIQKNMNKRHPTPKWKSTIHGTVRYSKQVVIIFVGAGTQCWVQGPSAQ